jgi:DNA-binding beta-propeller fold protein YncE
MGDAIAHPGRTFVVAILSLALASCTDSQPLHHPLTPLANIQLPKESKVPAIDLLTLDPRVGRLYVAHTSISSMDVIDVKTRKLAGSVPGVPGIKGVALTGDPNLVFASQTTGVVSAIDVAQLKVLAAIDVGRGPDAIEYDSVDDLVAVSLSTDLKIALVDPKTRKLVGTIPFVGGPELMSIDQHTGRIYLAINDRDQVVQIDIAARIVTKTYKGCDIKAPTGVAYDADDGRLFVASRGALNIIDVVLDRCLGSVDIGSGTDQIAYSSHTHHVYTADGGSKYLSVIDAVTMKPLGTVGTGRSASTLAIDPTTDQIYVAVKPAGIIGVYHDP